MDASSQTRDAPVLDIGILTVAYWAYVTKSRAGAGAACRGLLGLPRRRYNRDYQLVENRKNRNDGHEGRGINGYAVWK